MFNFYFQHGGPSWIATYGSWVMAIIGWVVVIALAIFGYKSNRDINHTNRIFAAKKDAYETVLSFVNKTQTSNEQVKLQEVAIIGAKLELFAPSIILEKYKDLEKDWQDSFTKFENVPQAMLDDKILVNVMENKGYGMASREKIDAFIALLKEDLGIK